MKNRSDASVRKRWFARLFGGALVVACLAADSRADPGPAPSGENQTAAMRANAPSTQKDPAATEQGTPRLKTKGGIELHVKDEDLGSVLEMLSRRYELNIVASKGAKGKVSADLYEVTIEQALDAICRANGLSWIREKNFIYVHTPQEIAAMRLDEARLETEVFTLNYLTAKEALQLIQPVLSTVATTAVTSASETGIPSGGEDVGGDDYGLPDAVVVRDLPENLAEVRRILEKMDRRPRQVLVEATVLQVLLDDDTSLGVNFNTLAGVDFRDLATPATPTTAPATVATLASQTDRAGEGAWGQVYTAGFATPGTGLNIGVITDSVSVFIQALEEVTDTTILSNPKVLALNKQRAEVIVGHRLGYRTTTVTETTAIETVEFLDVGTQLVFRPFISDDGYVRMEVHPEVSSGSIVNGLPRETTTEVTCNVMVKDGHTIVIGGLFDENVSIGRSQVPGLGNVPLFGWPFRSKSESTVRNEIIILLTPHVIEEEEAYALGEQMRDDADRRCLGMREGFHFLTRERLTAAYVKEADRAWRRFETTGQRRHLCWAWWHVQLALNVAPNNLRALRLKDKILSEMKGRPMRPKHWTIWDSVQERMKPLDTTKGLGPYQRMHLPPPGVPSPAPAPKEKKDE